MAEIELEVLLAHVPYRMIQGTIHQKIRAIAIHSQKVGKGGLFVCIKGHRQDGHYFIRQAVKQGTQAVIVDARSQMSAKEMEGYCVTVIEVPDTRKALAIISHEFYQHPSRKLMTIGITGTKGKTTTAYMVLHILRKSGIRAGYIGTLGIDCGDGMKEGENTTPESLYVAQAMAQMVKKRCQVVVIEASSQGLKLHRLDEILFDIGVYLNLTGDHIGPGEHKDMKEYAACKAMLLRRSMVGICNADDPYTEYMVRCSACREIAYFSTSFRTSGESRVGKSLINALGYRNQNSSERYEAVECCNMKWGHELGIRFGISTMDTEPYEIHIPGVFNVENALAAAVICRKLGVSSTWIREGMRTAKIPGRMENISVRDSYSIFIDYAHNATALRHILETLREYHPSRIICLFGCGGNRARDRRFDMGQVSGELADLSIVTSDNPRYEEPDRIIDDIMIGMKRTQGKYIRITDRREAIGYALSIALPGDIILLAGKGHETYQEIQGCKYPMDERCIVYEQRKLQDEGLLCKCNRGYFSRKC